MRKLVKLMAAGLAGLALGGCAHDSYREDPHHFSKDSHGHRVACYATDVANEYECVPAVRRYPYAYYDPFFYPYWGASIVYYPAYRGHHHHYVTPAPAPPPRGGRWHDRK